MTTSRTLLAALVAILAIEVLLGVLAYRSDRELAASARSADPSERVWAMHVLANRDEPRIYTADDLEELLGSGDPLLREYAMTYDFARGDGARIQRDVHELQPEEVRMGFFVWGQSKPFRRQRLNEFLGTVPD